MAEQFRIDTVVNAEGVAPGVAATVDGLKQVEQQTAATAAAAGQLTAEQKAAAEQARLYALAVAQLKSQDEAAAIRQIVAGLMAERAGLGEVTDAEMGVLDATKQVSNQQVETGETANRMIEHMSSIRGSRMAAMEFFETLQGGGTTIEGITNLMRLFILTSDLNPVMLAFAGVALALTGLIAKHDDAKTSVEGQKTAEEELGAASEKAAEKRIAAIGTVIDAFGRMMDQEARFNDALDRQEKYNQQAITDTNNLIAARTRLAVAELEGQRQVALGNAKSKDEADAINMRYNDLIAGKKSQSNADILANKVTASAEEIGAQVGDQARTSDSLREAQDELQKRRDNALSAQQSAADLGVLPDATGSYKEVQKLLGDQEAALIQALNAKPRDQNLKHEVEDTGAKLRAADHADDETVALQKAEQKLNPVIDRLQKHFDDLSTSLEKARTDNQVLQVEQATAAREAATAALKEKQAAAADAAKEAYNERQAKRKADVENWQKELGEGGIDPAIKAILQRNIAANAIAGDQDNLTTNSKTLSDAEKIELQGNIRAQQTGERVDADNDQRSKVNSKTQPAGPGADPTVYDQLQTSVDQTATALKQSGGHEKLVASFNKLLDLQDKATLLISNLAASSDSRLVAMAQRLSDCEAKLRVHDNHG